MNTHTFSPYRHDLEVLRAIAMWLIILFHGSLAYFDAPWPIQDVQGNEGLAVVFLVIHGFQMQLFFVMSGFFTAMMWRTRGLKAWLGHRFRRAFMPLAVGLITIIPLTYWINEKLVEDAFQQASNSAPSPQQFSSANIWSAVKLGDVESVKAHLSNEADLNAQDPEAGLTVLSWAALTGQVEIVEHLIRAGADVNGKNRDGTTPLHEAGFMGQDEIAAVLLQNGAYVETRDENGRTPLNYAQTDWGDTHSRIKPLQVRLDPVETFYGRIRFASLLSQYNSSGKTPMLIQNDVWRLLTTGRVFHHLWLFWFLCWLILAFALYATIAARFEWAGPPRKMMLSPIRYLWLIPLTMAAQWFMAGKGAIPSFGPDNSLAILPMPHIIMYYGIFFFWGAFYYDCDDADTIVGKQWVITMPIALLVIFPVTLILGLSPSSFQNNHLILLALKAVYGWLMVFSLMGISHELISRGNKVWRYVSNVAYWVYLTHLPLILVAQDIVQTWDLPGAVKFGLVCSGVVGVLLLIYQFFLRYTFVGTMLNRNQ